MKDPVIVEASEYADAVENYTGWCTTCEAFTRETTEPDAEDYDCPGCEQNTVMGAEQALIAGLIELENT